MSHKLYLNIPATVGTWHSWMAEGNVAAEYLRRLAAVMKLEVELISKGKILATLGQENFSTPCTPEVCFEYHRGFRFYCNENDSPRLTIDENQCNITLPLWVNCCKFFLSAGWVLDNAASWVMMHGALCEYEGKGVVLFGRGGIGKSTTARRYRAAGGHALSDDLLLINRADSGKYTVRPLPTWSDLVSGNKSVYPMIEALELNSILWLSRSGTTDGYLQPMPTNIRLMELCSAAKHPVLWVLSHVPAMRARASWQQIFFNIGNIAENFAPLAYHAGLKDSPQEIFADAMLNYKLKKQEINYENQSINSNT